MNEVIIAGAGSGKTKNFVDKIDTHIESGIDKDKILGLTFTEKAAFEFKVRSKLELKYFGTFHSVFYKLLTEYSNYYDFNIKDENSYNSFLENTMNNSIYFENEFKVKIGSIKDLDKFINSNIHLILECNTTIEFYELLNEKIVDKFQYSNGNIVKLFFEEKRNNKILSFSDILIYTYFMIKEDIKIRFNIKHYFTKIMIDEFQDSNLIVLEILEMIGNDNIFYVGDIYQSIYSFQGSSFNKTLEIINNNNVTQLDTNYRSNKNIVDYTNNFIKNNIKEKVDFYKEVKSAELVDNKNIQVIENISDFTIPELIYKSEDELNDICVLARNNNHIKEIKEQLEKWNVPFGYKNYKEFEYILDALLLNSMSDYFLNDKYFDRFKINTIQKTEHIIEAIQVIKEIFENTNINKYLLNRGFQDLQEKLDYWIYKQYMIFSKDKNLNLYLETIKKELDYFLENELYIEKIGINVMTIHKSKGLEWNSVILYNQENGIFPRFTEKEEEKRLYYVAITRAKQNLIITSKKKINSYTNKNLDYVNSSIISRKDSKYDLEFEECKEDDIDFISKDKNHKELIFEFVSKEEYRETYQDDLFYEEDLFNTFRRNKILNKVVKNFNDKTQEKIIKTINDITIEDIEISIEDIKVFQRDNKLDNIDLKNMISNIDLDKNLFFKNEKINNDYINNEFTDIIHRIINYRNWINEEEIENFRSEEREIKKFKKIVRHLVSKKNTDLNKDKAKKYIENKDLNIKNKHKNKNIINYEDFKNTMIRNYHIKSNNQKEYFSTFVLGMYNNIKETSMIDLTNPRYDAMKINLMLDFKHKNNDFVYNQEVLKGSFLNQLKTTQAHKRYAKLKYLEYVNLDKRAYFMTLTLPSIWHKWKTKSKSLKEERKYGDSSYLKDNKNYIMQGNNLEEHIINSAKKINEIWSHFYHILKVDIEHYKKENSLDKEFEVSFFKQLEPHKNGTSHCHILIFLDEEVKRIVKKAMNKTIIEFGLNRRFQDLQELAQVKDKDILTEEETSLVLMEIMRLNKLINQETDKKKLKGLNTLLKKEYAKLNTSVASPSSYIAKYMLKNAFKENNLEENKVINTDTSLEFFNAWESMLGNQVKITSMSNYKHTTQKHIDIMYKWYQENAPEAIRAFKRTDKPIYWCLEKQEVNKNFTFEYERLIKENFKNSNFIKDIEILFKLMKTNNITIEEIEEELEKKKIELDRKIINELCKNYSMEDKDKYLWELATNFVISSQEKVKYLNIHTNKKLVSAKVSEKLVYKYSKSSYVKAIEAFKEKINNEHLSFIPREWSFNWKSINGKFSLIENVLQEQKSKSLDTLIYVEDMYSRGWLKGIELLESCEFDTMTTINYEIEKIQYYDNYIHKANEKELTNLKTDPPNNILLLEQLLAA